MPVSPLLLQMLSRIDSYSLVDCMIEAGGNRRSLALVLAAADRVSRSLPPRRSPERPDVIAVYGAPSIDLLSGILGVLWAGHAYSFLERDTPPLVAQNMAHIADFCALLYDETAKRDVVEATGKAGVQIMDINGVFSSLPTDATPSGAPASIELDEAAYVLFTSGSTGQPKASCVSHRAADYAHRLYRRDMGIHAGTIIASETIWSFDVSTFDIFSLCAARELTLPPHGRVGEEPEQLLTYLQDSRASALFTVPSILSGLLARGITGRNLPGLQSVALSGEPVRQELVESFRACLPGVRLMNLFGMTEAPYMLATRLDNRSGNPNVFTVPTDDISLSIDDGEILWPVRDAPAGVSGELVIAGRALFNGYLGVDADPLRCRCRTSAGFGDLFAVTEERHLHFLGRRERTASRWGVTIYLDAVEALIERNPDVSRAAVISMGDTELVAFIEAVPAARGREIRVELLGKYLDRYQMPDRWVLIGRLPRRSNGKLDRERLGKVPAMVSSD